MVYLQITDPFVPIGTTLTKVWWQVASGIEFLPEQIECEEKDSLSINNKVFAKALIPDKTYYGRVKLFTEERGYGTWSDIDVFLSNDMNEVIMNMDLPSIVGVPLLTTIFNQDNHPQKNFFIKDEAFRCVGNARQEMSTCLITQNNKVVYERSGFIDNLRTIPVQTLLKPDKKHKVHVLHHGSNNDVSQVGGYEFVTAGNKIGLTTTTNLIDRISLAIDLELMFNDVFGLDSILVTLYTGDNIIRVKTTDTRTVTFDKSDLVENTDYILGFKPTIDGIVKEEQFSYFTTSAYVEHITIKYPPTALQYRHQIVGCELDLEEISTLAIQLTDLNNQLEILYSNPNSTLTEITELEAQVVPLYNRLSQIRDCNFSYSELPHYYTPFKDLITVHTLDNSYDQATDSFRIGYTRNYNIVPCGNKDSVVGSPVGFMVAGGEDCSEETYSKFIRRLPGDPGYGSYDSNSIPTTPYVLGTSIKGNLIMLNSDTDYINRGESFGTVPFTLECGC